MDKKENLEALDKVVRAIPKPEDQVSVVVLALALALRRFLTVRGLLAHRGARLKLVKATLKDVDHALRKYTTPVTPPVR